MQASDTVTKSPAATSGGGGLALMLEFFRYHGPLAPGVRLLRNLPMRSKALLVALAFSVPVLLLLWHYIAESSRALQTTERERDGLVYLRVLGSLSEVVRQEQYRALGVPEQRAASATPHEGGLQMAAGLIEQLQQHEAEAASLGARRSMEQLLSAWQMVEQASSMRAADRLSRLDAVQEAVHRHAEAVALGASLLLDPDAELHLQAEAMAEHLPRLAWLLQRSRSDLATFDVRSQRPDDVFRMRVGLIQFDDHLTAVRAHLEERARWSDAEFGAIEQNTRAFLHESRALLSGEVTQPATAVRLADQVMQQLDSLHGSMLERIGSRLDERAAQVRSQRSMVLWTVVLGLGAAWYLLMSFYRVMNGGLIMLRRQVAQMATGDLSARPRPWGKDEVAMALSSLSVSLARLADLFEAVRQGVAAVAQASHAIASGTADVNSRTERHAAGLVQIMDGVTRYIDQLDECGRRVDAAVEAVQALRLGSTRSRTNMDRLSERMKSLRGKSREIGEIVGLIDGIAFRTNILALNASVEAAKAGESGRGFAVVAQEVRALALRSAESARRITDIISRSTEDIEQSSELTEHAATTLDETEAQVNLIHEAMRDIVGLTRAGQSNSQEILEEIRVLNATTAENVKLVAQISTASNGLSHQGDRLSQKIESFKLE